MLHERNLGNVAVARGQLLRRGREQHHSFAVGAQVELRVLAARKHRRVVQPQGAALHGEPRRVRRMPVRVVRDPVRVVARHGRRLVVGAGLVDRLAAATRPVPGAGQGQRIVKSTMLVMATLPRQLVMA